MRQRTIKRDLRQVDRARTEKIKQHEGFYTTPKTPEGRPFFVFSEYGDYLFGKLLAKRLNHHINRTNSYQIAVDEGKQNGKSFRVAPGQTRIEEFFANRQLQRIIVKNELVGSRIRIDYIGRLKSQFGGHAAKIYEVFKDFGAITPDIRRQNQ